MRNRARHIVKHYIVRPFFLAITIIFLITSLLFGCTDILDNLKYNYILKVLSTPMSLQINNTVPNSTDRIYLDIEKSDWSKYEFTTTAAKSNAEINFHKTPYGATAILTSMDFGSNIDLKFDTFTKGEVKVKITFIDELGSEISSIDQLEIFERAPILDLILFSLIALTVLSFLLSFKLKHVIESIKRHSDKSSYKHGGHLL